MSAQTTHRRFQITVFADEFLITEVEPSSAHPFYSGSSDWWGHSTRDGAWMRARAQDRPVRFVPLNGPEVTYGVVFDVEAFERSCYRGYVSYGQSMTDGWYMPLTFEAWVVSFRKDPANDLKHGCDTYDEVKASLPTYLACRVAA